MVLTLDLLRFSRSVSVAHRSISDQRSLNRSLNKVAIIILNARLVPRHLSRQPAATISAPHHETFPRAQGLINIVGQALALLSSRWEPTTAYGGSTYIRGRGSPHHASSDYPSDAEAAPGCRCVP